MGYGEVRRKDPSLVDGERQRRDGRVSKGTNVST